MKLRTLVWTRATWRNMATRILIIHYLSGLVETTAANIAGLEYLVAHFHLIESVEVADWKDLTATEKGDTDGQ